MTVCTKCKRELGSLYTLHRGHEYCMKCWRALEGIPHPQITQQEEFRKEAQNVDNKKKP